MQYGYAYQLGERAGGLDPSAKAYINAIIAAGATVTSTQKQAINTFYKTGKAEGWYGQLKRMFLPIWGIAAPNAIGMISGSSGTFNGTVTHASGYVQGDGSTGYFNLGASPSSLGLTTSGGSVFALVNQADSRNDVRYMLGVQTSGNRRCYLLQVTSTLTRTSLYDAIGSVSPTTAAIGILLGNVSSTTSRYLKKRTSSGITTSTSTLSSSITAPTSNIFAMAINDVLGGSITGYSDARLGAYGIGVELTSTHGNQFTLALKNLWESCTGLTIP